MSDTSPVGGGSAVDHRGRPRVAVTGLGVKSPAGNDVASFWETVLAGRSMAADIESFDTSGLPVRFACEVKGFDAVEYLGPKEVRRVDRNAQLGFAAGIDALRDAGDPGADPARCAVVAGVGIGGLATLEEQEKVLIERGPSRVTPFLVPMMMPNATPAIVAMELGWTGPNICVATACAAGTHAVGEGARLIRDGTADVVLAGGAEAVVTPIAIAAFARMGALSGRHDDPGSASRPFDVDRDGFVMGEGAAFLVLERLDRALARGARIYGEVLGYGRNADAYHITAPSPGGSGATACMQLALDDAGLAPSAIGHVNAHGTSTPLNDASEAEAIVKVFGGSPPPVTSTKGVTGHLIAAAGAVEAVASILAVRDGKAPPPANHERADAEMGIDVIAGEPRELSGPVLSNSFGFGGHNATLVVGPVTGRRRMTLSLEPGGGGLSMGLPVAGRASAAATACLRRLDGHDVALFRLDGGKHRGAIGPAEGVAIERLVTLAIDLGLPIVGVMATSGADIHEGVASLHAWGRVARQVSRASGAVPIIFVVVGPCTSGPALMLGLADHVVMTPDSFAYVSGPEAVAEFTGITVDRARLGGGPVHDTKTGVASLVAADEEDALLAVADLLSYLPANHVDDPPRVPLAGDDPLDRPCGRAASVVPDAARASYDVRTVLADVLDEGSLLEVRARYASNLVTAYGRLGGRPVGIVANQPNVRAGTLDIEASRKAARFVQHCDAFNLPILTFVDTPGFEPGKDLEWRGMIRHGAELVHAYAAATVPRICLVLRKAYGGAYIVMDSRRLGNDACFAWPGAEIAVMGSKGAVQILFGKKLAGIDNAEVREKERAALEADYDARFCSPLEAAERGLVDEVIDPHDTRRVLAAALAVHASKRETAVARKHSISPC